MQTLLTYFVVVEVESDRQTVSKGHNEYNCQDNLEGKLMWQVLEGGRLQK